MGYTRRDVETLPKEGSKVATIFLDGTTTTDSIKLGGVASKITFQTTEDLACSVEVSLNGTDWSSAGSGSTTMVSYDTHNVIAVRATRTSGSGKLILAASV